MFGFNFDRKTLYIILGVIALFSILSMGTNGIISLIVSIPGVLLAITFHEFAHAYAAYKLGDNTPKYQGRLSLNPLSHLDPFGIIILLFAHIGWGKPVEIDSRNFSNNRFSLSACEAIVAIAGPIMNFILAIVLAVIMFFVNKFAPYAFVASTLGLCITSILKYAVIINIGLGVFNLIPLPPLDGSKVLMHFLNYEGKVWMINNERIFTIVFLVLWILGILGRVVSPIIEGIYSGLMNLMWIIF